MRSTDVDRAEAIPFRIVPETGQIPEKVSERGPSVDSKEVWDVLHEDESGSKNTDEAREGRPEPPLVVLRSLPSGSRDGLAREASDDGVDGLEGSGVDEVDVSVTRNVREPAREYRTRVLVPLDLPPAAPPGALEPEVDPSDPGEERPEGRSVIVHLPATP